MTCKSQGGIPLTGRASYGFLFIKKIKWTIFSLLIAAVLVGGGLFIYVQTTTAVISTRINTDSFGVAIRGYDTVAYHTEGRPVKGKNEIFYSWNDARWQFATAENRDLFVADPERYAPRYGGY